MKSAHTESISIAFIKALILFFLITCLSLAVNATTYTSIGPGLWNDEDTWSGGTVPPSTLGGNDIVNINHRVVESSGTIKLDRATLNVNNILLLTSGSLEMEHANDRVNINSGVIIILNGSFLNKKGLVTINGGGIQMCNSGFKDESTGNSKGTIGTGYIYTDNGNIENIGNSPFSSNIAWCSESGGQVGMPTSEDCSAIDPPTCNDETYYLGFSLPVELFDFTATKTNNEVSLKWVTVSEVNNEKFILEYAENGTDFQYLSEQAGQGTTNNFTEYFFVHKNARTLQSDIIYYRLKQIDFDGKFEYSKIISVHFEKNKNTSLIFPNPVISGRSFILENEIINHIEIIDAQNRLIFDKKINKENTAEISTSFLEPGIYFIRINDQEMQKLIVLK
ncbi:MAG: T9SS type A sorting domain-containing protein [Bacteroidota bacterium]